MADRDIIARLRLAGEQFSQDLNQELDRVPAAADRAGTEAGEKFSAGFGEKLAGLAVAGAAAIAAVGQAVGQSLDFAKDLGATSRELNVSVEHLQEWRHAAREMGASAEELDASLGSLNDKVEAAHGGSRDAQQSFVDLGVGFNTVSGRARETDNVFEDVIDRLSKIADPSKRAELATSLLGDEFERLMPLAEGGAKGLDKLEESARRYGVVISSEAIRNLDVTNAKLADMRDILTVQIATVVADNADAIVTLANGLNQLASSAAGAVRWYREFKLEQGIRQSQIVQDGWFVSPQDKAAAAKQEQQYRLALARSQGKVDVTGGFRDYSLAPIKMPDADPAAPPTLTPKPSKAVSKRGGSSSAPKKTDEERAAEQAAKEREAAIKRAWENEAKLGESIDKTIQKQNDSARVEEVRAGLGERAAAEEEARLAFEREHPEAVAQSVEQLAVLLGITKDIVTANQTLTAEQKKQLQTDLDKINTAKQGAVKEAGDKVDAKAAEEQANRDKEAVANWRRMQEDAIRDVSGLYEDLFAGGTHRLFDDFKTMGLRAVSEVAAKWTLATISGQSINIGQALNTSIGQSPLGSLFGGGTSSGAANDNQSSAAFQAAFKDLSSFGSSSIVAGDQPMPGTTDIRLGAGKSGSLLDQAGFALAASSLVSLTGIGGGGTGSQIGSLAGGLGGQALGKTIGALGNFGGPVGAVVGTVLGSVLGGVLDGVLNPNRTAGAHLTSISDVSISGKDKKNYGAAGSLGDSVVSGLQQIADALGADLGSFNTTIGVRGGDYRVNADGTSLKLKNGAVNYGEDAEAAVAAAIQDAINDGVLVGVSQASQNILKSGQDLEEAITKATLIESVPKLLRERLDPLGAALDAVDEKFKDLADALKEGGASADQIAQARELWQLEREDTIKQIGAASATLKSFLDGLSVGSNSPYSLRQQEAAARETLSPYQAEIEAAKAAQAEVDRIKVAGGTEAQIKAAEEAARVAAGKIDQEGFQEAAQALLGIKRSINGSSGGFFTEFDQIKQLTSDAISLIEAGATQATDPATDPFSALIAANTTDTANILADQTTLLTQAVTQLKALNDNILSYSSFGAYLKAQRGYT